MKFAEAGERIKTLEKTMDEITSVYGLANPTGIRAVKFINAKKGLLNIRNNNWKKRFKLINYAGVTPIGTSLRLKVIDRFVWTTPPMKKPLLVVIITDGEVSSRSTFNFGGLS